MPAQAVYTVQPVYDETLKTGQQDVAIAGTAEALGSAAACIEILIQAKRSNTSRVYIGGSNVLNNDTNGVYLTAGQSMTVSATNINQVYVNAVVGGEGVTFIYW